MNALKCDLCGSSDIIKDGEYFVCQYCKTKYTVDAVRRMRVEGTVRIDSTEETKNLYELARRAKDTDNAENAAKYYGMILLKNPSDWEANFYSVYYKEMGCSVSNIPLAVTNVKNCIKTTLELIRDNTNDAEQKESAVKEIDGRIKPLTDSLVKMVLPSGSDNGKEAKNLFMVMAGKIAEIRPAFLDHMCEVFSDDEEFMRGVGCDILKNYVNQFKALEKSRRDQLVSYIKKYDPSFVDQVDNQSGGCYVATSVYGSYDCPEVWTLRRFRDYDLAITWYGRAFIRIYYAVSPTIVELFGDNEWFKKKWKRRLDHMVEQLKKKGFESTPYEDQNW